MVLLLGSKKLKKKYFLIFFLVLLLGSKKYKKNIFLYFFGLLLGSLKNAFILKLYSKILLFLNLFGMGSAVLLVGSGQQMKMLYFFLGDGGLQ